MKKSFKFTSIFVIMILSLVLFVSCTLQNVAVDDDIVVLFTNDVHCGIDQNMGYAGIASYKKHVEKKTDYVTLVDCGDAIQGEVIGTVSNGEYIVDIMNHVGYDLAIPGNHEFDYGMDQLEKIIDKANATYLGCNIKYTGSETNKLSAVKPYEIKTYGSVDVAFIGVITPESLTKSTPIFFQENGEFVYDFYGKMETEFYANVQKYVDETIARGADYVVVLSHLGDDTESSPFTSVELINNITGVDALLDGHAHSTISSKYVEDKAGKKVVMASSGSKLNAIGQLVIGQGGVITTSLVSDYEFKDAETVEYIEGIKALYNEAVNKVVATSNIALSIKDENGVRLVRTRETAIGNLCADAYRFVGKADIGFVNGGGIRASLAQGDLTYANIIAVHPFGNMLCVVEATGQQILDYLEMATRATKGEYVQNGNAYGESGGFANVSGIKFSIDTTIESTVKLDDNGMFEAITGDRRVKDVMVLENDVYVPIDPAKTYTVASHNYMIKNGGDGFTMFQNGNLLVDEAMFDNEVLITYITKFLNGDLSAKYSSIEGRITILK